MTMLRTITYLIVLLAVVPPILCQVSYKGVNIAGGEFGKIPGTLNIDYCYPNATLIDYFIRKGFNTYRIPFRWERLQKAPNTPLVSAEIAIIDGLVNYITSKSLYVILDVHNYARYYGEVIGDAGSSVTIDNFVAFWQLLATKYQDNLRVMFGIMNEPYDLPTELWKNTTNKVIQGIRAAGATNIILVPGNAWTGAYSWFDNWYGTPNADVLGDIVDTQNNFMYEFHQYLDFDHSGKGTECVSTTVGQEGLATVTQWLRLQKRRGFLAEFATPPTESCLVATDNMLDFMYQNADAWGGWAFWAAGDWFAGDYPSNISPLGDMDRVQMRVLEKYLSANDSLSGTTLLPPTTSIGSSSTVGSTGLSTNAGTTTRPVSSTTLLITGTGVSSTTETVEAENTGTKVAIPPLVVLAALLSALVY